MALVDGKLIVCRSILADFLIKRLALSLQTLHVRGKPLKLRLGRHRLLEHHLNALEALGLVLKLAPKDIVAELTVASSLGPQIVEHAIRGDIV